MQTAGRSVMLAALVVGVLAVTTTAHMFSFGSCRDFNGMENFDPARFNGTWYVIKKIATRSSCLTVNYNLMEDGQSFRVEEIRRPPYTDVIPLDLSVTNAGMLNRRGTPSKYSVTWYSGIIPMTGIYTLVDTDYDTFALDYECHEILGVFKRVSATILSRTQQMDTTLVDELENRLVSEFDVPKNRLNLIDQDSCVDLDANDFNLVVDEEGLRSALKEYEMIQDLTALPKEKAEEYLNFMETSKST